MRKHVLFSAMLALGMLGGLSAYPVPAMALVAQQTIKVSGQVVDQEGEPLIGATVKLKGHRMVSLPTSTESLPSMHLPMVHSW